MQCPPAGRTEVYAGQEADGSCPGPEEGGEGGWFKSCRYITMHFSIVLTIYILADLMGFGENWGSGWTLRDTFEKIQL